MAPVRFASRRDRGDQQPTSVQPRLLGQASSADSQYAGSAVGHSTGPVSGAQNPVGQASIADPQLGPAPWVGAWPITVPRSAAVSEVTKLCTERLSTASFILRIVFFLA
jgi:hypothetical protein